MSLVKKWRKIGFRLVTSAGQRNSESLWGITHQTCGFRALMLHYWATGAPWWARPLTMDAVCGTRVIYELRSGPCLLLTIESLWKSIGAEHPKVWGSIPHSFHARDKTKKHLFQRKNIFVFDFQPHKWATNTSLKWHTWTCFPGRNFVFIWY